MCSMISQVCEPLLGCMLKKKDNFDCSFQVDFSQIQMKQVP